MLSFRTWDYNNWEVIPRRSHLLVSSSLNSEASLHRKNIVSSRRFAFQYPTVRSIKAPTQEKFPSVNLPRPLPTPQAPAISCATHASTGGTSISNWETWRKQWDFWVSRRQSVIPSLNTTELGKLLRLKTFLPQGFRSSNHCTKNRNHCLNFFR